MVFLLDGGAVKVAVEIRLHFEVIVIFVTALICSASGNMGICMSAEDKANAAQAAESQKLDRELEAARDKESKTVKLLLLGMLSLKMSIVYYIHWTDKPFQYNISYDHRNC